MSAEDSGILVRTQWGKGVEERGSRTRELFLGHHDPPKSKEQELALMLSEEATSDHESRDRDQEKTILR